MQSLLSSAETQKRSRSDASFLKPSDVPQKNPLPGSLVEAATEVKEFGRAIKESIYLLATEKMAEEGDAIIQPI